MSAYVWRRVGNQAYERRESGHVPGYPTILADRRRIARSRCGRRGGMAWLVYYLEGGQWTPVPESWSSGGPFSTLYDARAAVDGTPPARASR